jgi:hypothetical protein
LRSLLWVPATLGVVLGGLAIADILAAGLDVAFVGAPQTVVEAYNALTDAVFFLLFERWVAIEIPNWLKDLTVVWLAFGASNLRAVFWLGGKVTLGGKFVAFFIRTTGSVNSFAKELFRATAVFVLGPIATILMLIQEMKWLARAIASKLLNFDQWRERYDDIIQRSLESSGKTADELYRQDKSNFRSIWSHTLNFSLLLFTIVLNAAVAAGLLWWNSAEIARLTA